MAALYLKVRLTTGEQISCFLGHGKALALALAVSLLWEIYIHGCMPCAVVKYFVPMLLFGCCVCMYVPLVCEARARRCA